MYQGFTQCRYSSASGGFQLLVPSDRAVICSDKPVRSFLLVRFHKAVYKLTHNIILLHQRGLQTSPVVTWVDYLQIIPCCLITVTCIST